MSENNFNIIKNFTKATKKNITEGKLPQLTDRTKEARSRGLSSFKKSVNPLHNRNRQTDEIFKPLLYTGDLEKSIKANTEGIEMRPDGVLHHDGGWKTPKENIGFGANKTVRARPFIVGTKSLPRDKKEMKKLENKTVDALNKAMKK